MQQRSSCAIHNQPYSLIDGTNYTLICTKCAMSKSNNKSQIFKIAEFVKKQHQINNQIQKGCRNLLVQCLLQQLKHLQISNISLEAIKELEIVKLKIKEINRQSIQLLEIHDLASLNIKGMLQTSKINGIKSNLDDVQKNYDLRINYELENVNLFLLLDQIDKIPPKQEMVEQLKKSIKENKCSSQLTQIFSDFYKRVHSYDIILPSPLKLQHSCDTAIYKEIGGLKFEIQKFQDNLIEELQEQHDLLNNTTTEVSDQLDPVPFSDTISVYDESDQSKDIMVEKELEDLQIETDQQQSKQKAYKFAQECVQSFTQENYLQAQKQINDALMLNQENSQYFYLQSMCLIKLQNYSEAIQAIDKAIELQKIPYYFYIKGKILSYEGFKKSALKQLRICTKLNDSIEGCYLLTAQIYEQFGQEKQAFINYEKVLRINPFNQRAQQGIENLQ